MSDDKTALPNELFLQETIRGQQLLLQELLLKDLSAEAKKREDAEKNEEENEKYIYETILNCVDKEYKNIIVEKKKIIFDHTKYILSIIIVMIGSILALLNMNIVTTQLKNNPNPLDILLNINYASAFSVFYIYFMISIFLNIIAFLLNIQISYEQVYKKNGTMWAKSIFNKNVDKFLTCKNEKNVNKFDIKKLAEYNINCLNEIYNSIIKIEKKLCIQYLILRCSFSICLIGFLFMFFYKLNIDCPLSMEDALQIIPIVIIISYGIYSYFALNRGNSNT